MSNHLTSEVYKRQLGGMARKAVMVLLADKASDDGSGIWAGKQRMAEEIGTTRQTVISTIKALIADGLVIEVAQRKCLNGFTVEYAINVAALRDLPLVKSHCEDPSSSLTRKAALHVKQDNGTRKAALHKPPLNPQLSTEPNGSSESKRARAKPAPFPCPDGVDPIDWDSLMLARKAQRAPMNDGAYRKICSKLDGWRRDGWPPGPIVANAVERGWRTVFETDEMKEAKNGGRTQLHGSPRPASTDRRDGVARALDRRLGLDDPSRAPGRCVAGEGSEYRQLPPPSADPLF